MKILFIVKDRSGRVVRIGKETFDQVTPFTNKMQAKAARDELGGISAGFYVTQGSGHMGLHGAGHTPVMRRQPKRVKFLKGAVHG